AFAQRTEKRGYGALWSPESRGRSVLGSAACLLAGTSKLVVASGIASSYAREAMAMPNAPRRRHAQSTSRLRVAMGSSDRPMVSDVRGHTYGPPVVTMRAYLEAMHAAPYQAPPPSEPCRTLLAALGPKMLALAAELTDGAHPYCVTPEHTAQARRILGPG